MLLSSVKEDAATSFWAAVASFQLQRLNVKAKGPKDLYWLSAHHQFYFLPCNTQARC